MHRVLASAITIVVLANTATADLPMFWPRETGTALLVMRMTLKSCANISQHGASALFYANLSGTKSAMVFMGTMAHKVITLTHRCNKIGKAFFNREMKYLKRKAKTIEKRLLGGKKLPRSFWASEQKYWARVSSALRQNEKIMTQLIVLVSGQCQHVPAAMRGTRKVCTRDVAKNVASVTVHPYLAILTAPTPRSEFLDHFDQLPKGIDKAISACFHVVRAGPGDTQCRAGAATGAAA